jgi:hypothetical protein
MSLAPQILARVKRTQHARGWYVTINDNVSLAAARQSYGITRSEDKRQGEPVALHKLKGLYVDTRPLFLWRHKAFVEKFP